MARRHWIGLSVVLGCAAVPATARASGGDPIGLEAAAYVVVGVPVAVNVALTTVDIAAALRNRPVPRLYAGLELALSSAQVAILAAFMLDQQIDNPYLFGYMGWSAGLAAHGLVSLVTSPDLTRPKKSARTWDVVAAPVARSRGAHFTLVRAW